jgi:Ca2+-binding EF-hand superfamily protein
MAGVPTEALGALFASFDPDGDRYIEYAELHQLLTRSKREQPDLPPLELEAKNPIALRKKRIDPQNANLLQSLTLDASDLDSIPGQIKAALQRESLRVLDLFRQMDDDGSGDISKKEFRKALSEVGLRAPHEAIDALFMEFDKDGCGTIEYNEYASRPSNTTGLATALATGLATAESRRLRS